MEPEPPELYMTYDSSISVQCSCLFLHWQYLPCHVASSVKKVHVPFRMEINVAGIMLGEDKSLFDKR